MFNTIFNKNCLVKPHILYTFVIINYKNVYVMKGISWNTKAVKRVRDSFSEKAIKIVENIGPTIFDTDIKFEDKPITSLFSIINTNYHISKTTIVGKQYVMLGDELFHHKHLLTRNAQILIDYICINIGWCSNAIKFTMEDVMLFHKMDDHGYYNALDELININLLRKTTRKSIYIINHNYIFKGSLADFVQIYTIAYPNPAKVNADGKIIIEEDIREVNRKAKEEISNRFK